MNSICLCDYLQRIQITDINDAVIAAAVNNKLEYIEVAPCSTALFASIIEKVDHQNTIVRAQIDDDHELVGNINQFYIYIYDMTKPPSEQLSILPDNITYLGLRFDTTTSLSPEWWGFLFRLKKLELLVLDCRPSMLGALLKRKDKVLAFLPNLSVIAITINVSRITRPKWVQNVLRDTVDTLFNDIPMIENVILQFVGFTALNLGPMCQHMGVEHTNGKPQVTFNCFNENRRPIEEIDIIDIGRREARAILYVDSDGDGFDDDEWQHQFKTHDDDDNEGEENNDFERITDLITGTTEANKKIEKMIEAEENRKVHTNKPEMVEVDIETTQSPAQINEETEESGSKKDVSLQDAVDKLQIATYPDNDQTFSFMRYILNEIQSKVDTCRKFTKRWISFE